MPYVAFRDHFPEVANPETRMITINRDGYLGLPAGDYLLFEMFCDEPGCDCRRVFFSVGFVPRRRMVAVVAYGWEPPEFYARWMGNNDPQDIRELKGPILNLASPQSELAPAILRMIESLIVPDERYIERVKAHYRMFREKIDGKGGARKGKRRPKRVTND